MADQGKWFKLHCDFDDDPDISSLTVDDQLRWIKLGTYMKKHGTDGFLKILPPALPLQYRFRVGSFEDVVSVLLRMPSYAVERRDESNVSGLRFITVSCPNWSKYQGDLSTSRVRKFRAYETAKRRGEEKRTEEKRITPYPAFLDLWKNNCPNLPQIRDLTAKRKIAIQNRWDEKPDLDYWQSVAKRLSQSSFAKGTNDTGWRADFDFFLRPDTHIKIMEGKYDDRKAAPSAGFN